MSRENMDIFIYCAGKGTRMRPYSVSMPKPLLPMGNEDFPLYSICRNLKKVGVYSAVVNYSYGRKFFEDAKWRISKELDFEIRLIHEEEPLGHAGGLKNAENLLKAEHILALNGDTMIGLTNELVALLNNSCSPESPFCILGMDVSDEDPLGVSTDGQLLLMDKRRFTDGAVKRNYDASGVFMIDRSVLKMIPRGEFVGFFGEGDLVEIVTQKGKKCVVISMPKNIARTSIGDKKEYESIIRNNKSE